MRRTLLLGIGSLVIVVGGVLAVIANSGALASKPKSDPWVGAAVWASDRLTLQGFWASVMEYDPATIVTDKDGNITSVQTNPTSFERLAVDAGYLEDTLAEWAQAGFELIPDDCRTALKWSAEDGTIWASQDYADTESLSDGDGSPCAYIVEGPSLTAEEWTDGERVQAHRRIHAMHQVGSMPWDYAETGLGEVHVVADGKIAIGYYGEGDPDLYSILCATKKSGDRYFWVIKH